MKRALWVLLLLAALPLRAGTYFQFGVETFLGGRYRLFSLAPWAGLRFSLADSSSLIVKFRQQSIAFDFVGADEVERRQKSSLSMVTGVYYYQKGKLDAYVALFQMLGSRGYSSTGADAGAACKLGRVVALETGLYLLNEKSTLWYPEEPPRRISTYVWHAGVTLDLAPKLELNPQVHFGNNSDHVSTFAYSAGLTYSPRDPIYITLTYVHYSENEQVRFSGDYVWGGINFYF